MTAIVTSSLIPKTRTRDLAQRDDVVGWDGMAILRGTAYEAATVTEPAMVVLRDQDAILIHPDVWSVVAAELRAAGHEPPPTHDRLPLRPMTPPLPIFTMPTTILDEGVRMRSRVSYWTGNSAAPWLVDLV